MKRYEYQSRQKVILYIKTIECSENVVFKNLVFSLFSINSWTVRNDQEWRKWQSSLAKMHRFFVFVQIEKYWSLSVVDWQFLPMPNYSRSCFQWWIQHRLHGFLVCFFFLIVIIDILFLVYILTPEMFLSTKCILRHATIVT